MIRHTDSPFILDEEGELFADALLVQFVPSAKIVFPDGMGPGFFAEAPEAPGPGWERARLATSGKAVEGWAAREIRLAPVALRFRWVTGQPGAWSPLDHYEQGARGHAQVLGVLRTEGAEPLWAVITAKGIASRDIVRAFRAHKVRVARRFRVPQGRVYAPFAAWMTIQIGESRRMPAGVVHGLALAEEELVLLPEALGWAIRERLPEAARWKAAWEENGEAIRETEETPMPIPEPEPVAEAPDLAEAPPGAASPPPAHTPEATPEVAPEALPPAPAPALEGPGPDAEAALVFLLSQGGEEAMARLRQAFPGLPEELTEAVRALAQRQPRAAFWGKASQAVDLFLAWSERFPVLARNAPARLRALKERLGIVPAAPQPDEDLARLAALAALRWLFRPREREDLERLVREP